MNLRRFPVALFVSSFLPFIHGKATLTGDPHEVVIPSEHYLFEPVLTNCVSCLTADGRFSTRQDDGSHVTEFGFSLSANGTTFHISLEKNEVAIPAGFSVSYLGHDWDPPTTYKEESHEEINNCYYHGSVDGIKNSRVIASTCRGLRGTIFLPNDKLQFAPIEKGGIINALYRDEKSPESSCGNEHDDFFQHIITEQEAKSSAKRFKRSGDEQKYIELLFVANKELYESFATMVDLHDYVKEIANYMDNMYKLINLRVVLLHLEVWTVEDKIPATTDAQANLESFLAYRAEKVQESGNPDSPWKYTDDAQLIFGGDFDGNKLGMASVGTMCTVRAAGVNMKRDTAHNTAATMTHEMGHNFGMQHDDGSCECKVNQCIMAASASGYPPEDWSDCSQGYLDASFRNGLDVCLYNELDSSKLFGGPKCGNSIVELEEECDCGLVGDCVSPCCNASTCKLLDGALCDSGSCCTDDCQYKDTCHICREKKNDCDIIEYCTGQQAHCPSDIHKLDGLECYNNSGLCYSGACRTHDNQCQVVWGPDGYNADITCYEYVNKFGDWKGNCGVVNSTFKACPIEDSLCGKLICSGGSYTPILSFSKKSFQINMPAGQCKSVESKHDPTDTDSEDVTLVYDGTMCGDRKICFNHVCSDIDDVVTPCAVDCHGHGVCNNFGNCHCDAGYGPPDCKDEGPGGSADSGPICANATYPKPIRPTDPPVVSTTKSTNEQITDPQDNNVDNPDNEQPTEPNSEQPTEPNNEQPTDPNNEQPADPSSEQTTEPVKQTTGIPGPADAGARKGTDLEVVVPSVTSTVVPVLLGVSFLVWWKVFGGQQKLTSWRANRMSGNNAEPQSASPTGDFTDIQSLNPNPVQNPDQPCAPGISNPPASDLPPPTLSPQNTP